jgi:light-regulated signal transduction histidine kinase (bacteriophytochrome)
MAASGAEDQREQIGVIVHDLNNRLGVIVSYATLLEPQLPDAGATADLADLKQAATEAVGLARQLADSLDNG